MTLSKNDWKWKTTFLKCIIRLPQDFLVTRLVIPLFCDGCNVLLIHSAPNEMYAFWGENGGSAHSTRQALTYISMRKRGISQLNETSPNIHLGEKTGISPLNETSPNIHLGEKTGDQPTQRDKP
ncbi:hypothetical protein TNCV_612052 [Trichonephila clavipes]|nr:hypothetical protein TNCV_612052 [Trichonephila clavipes]